MELSALPILFIILGLLMYFFGNEKVKDIGRLVFFAAFLAWMLANSGKAIHLSM